MAGFARKKGLRWWLAWVMLLCAAVAWLVAVALYSTGHFRWLWLPGWGVIASWPVYVLSLKIMAHSEARDMLAAARDWHFLKANDEQGDAHDRNIEDRVDGALRHMWNSRQGGGTPQGQFAGIFFLIILTVGTWLIWDLLRMGPALLAEIILDGDILPANPALSDRLPISEPWYKTALLNTGLHFISAAGIATLIEVLVKIYWPRH